MGLLCNILHDGKNLRTIIIVFNVITDVINLFSQNFVCSVNGKNCNPCLLLLKVANLKFQQAFSC